MRQFDVFANDEIVANVIENHGVQVVCEDEELREIIEEYVEEEHEFVVGGPSAEDGDQWLHGVPAEDPGLLDRAMLGLPAELEASTDGYDFRVEGDFGKSDAFAVLEGKHQTGKHDQSSHGRKKKPAVVTRLEWGYHAKRLNVEQFVEWATEKLKTDKELRGKKFKLDLVTLSKDSKAVKMFNLDPDSYFLRTGKGTDELSIEISREVGNAVAPLYSAKKVGELYTDFTGEFTLSRIVDHLI